LRRSYYADAQTAGEHTALIEHFDGSAWSIIPSPANGVAQHLNGLFTHFRTRNVWVVGAFSTTGDDPETDLLQVANAGVIYAGRLTDQSTLAVCGKTAATRRPFSSRMQHFFGVFQPLAGGCF